MGFTQVMTPEASTVDFINKLKTDGQLDVLNKYRKDDAPILCFESIDMDSQIRGGWRVTYCLAESDITDVNAFMKYNPFVWHIDASKWLIFEHISGDGFNDNDACTKLGYRWNGIISGSFSAFPDGKIDGSGNTVYNWYPVK